MVGKSWRCIKILDRCLLKVALFSLLASLSILNTSCTPETPNIKKRPGVFVKGVPIEKTKYPDFFPIHYAEMEITRDPNLFDVPMQELIISKNSKEEKLLKINGIKLYTITFKDQIKLRKLLRSIDKKEFAKLKEHTIKKGSLLSFLPFYEAVKKNEGTPQITLSKPNFISNIVSLQMTFWTRTRGAPQPPTKAYSENTLSLSFSPEEYLLILPTNNASKGIGERLNKTSKQKYRFLLFFFEQPYKPKTSKILNLN